MNEAPSEPIKPTDPDMLWTGWALHMVREAAEIDMRSKRMTERQQERADSDSAVDFGQIQSRLSRSLRLSVALAERIRIDYLMRRGEREASGEQQRRRQKREQAVEAVVKATATPIDGEGAEHLRSVVWKRVVEDEILDAQLDSLSPEEFVQAVCRKIGRPPPPIPLPQGCGEAVEDAPQAEPAETADHEPAEDWVSASGESGTGRPMPRPSTPDSS